MIVFSKYFVVNVQPSLPIGIYLKIPAKEIKKNDIVTTKIINNMINNLYELEKAYPKNIKIKEENNEINTI